MSFMTVGRLTKSIQTMKVSAKRKRLQRVSENFEI